MKPKIGNFDNRPWGNWKTLDCGDGFHIKRITVFPGKRLSLQSHQHRKEHWIIIAGKALVEVDGNLSSLYKGEYIDIPLKCKHRLSNLEDEELIVNEVQFGNYLGEDDIKRYEDDFGRN